MEQGHYNRKERKKLAKKLGLVNKNETFQERNDRVFRSIEAGKQLQQQFLMQTENNLRNQEVEREALYLRRLIERVGEEEAEKIMANNRKAEEKRQEKLFKKKNRQ